ncbi:MAG: NADH:flavin oxidoreductase [Armatimonadetes bacterium]|nr:NADH:flavin oxidoreductase [Armatimonadota bacterium]
MSMLFSPVTIGGVSFRNRVVMPPMVTGLGDGEGHVTEAIREHYGLRARAGTGLVIVEATAVAEQGRCWANGLGAWSDAHVSGLRGLAEVIHAGGALAGIQLVHGGPQASPAVSGGETVGPSAVRPSEKHPVPRALTLLEIQEVQRRFAEAAARVVAAGFDVVEAHGAHGYLLDSFLSARRNTRTDGFGGSSAGRARMVVETCRGIRARIGTAALVECRIGVFNKLAEGFGPEDLRSLVAGLADAGLDLLHISTDGAFKGCFDSPKPVSRWIREMAALPLIVAGGLGHPADAERAVAEGLADLAAVGRAQLEDPQWARRAEAALSGEGTP